MTDRTPTTLTRPKRLALALAVAALALVPLSGVIGGDHGTALLERLAGNDFLVRAECDIDGDGILSIYEATRAERATMKTGMDIF